MKGQYLKDVYAKKINKGMKQGDGCSRTYVDFFHTSYPSIGDTVIGMDGYGGIALLINLSDGRIVSSDAAHRDYDYSRIILGAIEDGDI